MCAVKMAYFKHVQVDTIDATQIYLDGRAAGAGAMSKGGAPTGAAEFEVYRLLVPSVIGDVFRRSPEGELVGCREMVERTPAPADGAVAGHRLGRQILFDAVCELAAMTASGERHPILLSTHGVIPEFVPVGKGRHYRILPDGRPVRRVLPRFANQFAS
jgi:hypothetical protein